jgi:hypothetical protein
MCGLFRVGIISIGVSRTTYRSAFNADYFGGAMSMIYGKEVVQE